MATATAHIGSLLEEKNTITASHGIFSLVTLSKDDTLGVALRKLAGHKILAAPVKVDNQFVFVDILDIIAAAMKDNNLSQNFSQTIGSIVSASGSNSVLSVDWMQPVAEAMRLLTATHRILVVEPGSEATPVGILSQMDIIKWAVKNWTVLPVSLRELPIHFAMNKHIVSAREEDSIAEVIHKCLEHHFGGVAVLNKNGEMDTSFSISDLRHVSVDNMQTLLNLNVHKFLQETKQFLQKEVVTVTAERHFFDILKLMHQSHVHRVYVVDEHKRPIGIVTSSDVLLQLAKHITLNM